MGDPLTGLLIDVNWGLSEKRFRMAHVVDKGRPIDARRGVYTSLCGQARCWELDDGEDPGSRICRICVKFVTGH